MTQQTFLQGKKGLVVGIANADSIAFGCARAFLTSCPRSATESPRDCSDERLRTSVRAVAARVLLLWASDAAADSPWGGATG